MNSHILQCIMADSLYSRQHVGCHLQSCFWVITDCSDAHQRGMQLFKQCCYQQCCCCGPISHNCRCGAVLSSQSCISVVAGQHTLPDLIDPAIHKHVQQPISFHAAAAGASQHTKFKQRHAPITLQDCNSCCMFLSGASGGRWALGTKIVPLILNLLIALSPCYEFVTALSFTFCIAFHTPSNVKC